MKSRSYSHVQGRDFYILNKEQSHKKRSAGLASQYSRKRHGFSSSEFGSDRDNFSSNASPNLRTDRYRDRTPVTNDYVVVRGTTGGKSVISTFSASSRLSISPPLKPSNHRPKIGKTYAKRCQSCRQVVKKSSVGSAHLQCRECSGLWHRACGPLLPPPQTHQALKNFICLTCQASAPSRKSQQSKRSSRNHLPFMEACAILDVCSSPLQNSDVDIMGDDDEEVDKPLIPKDQHIPASIPNPPVLVEEDDDICLTCDGDCSCHPYLGPTKSDQSIVTNILGSDEEMASSPLGSEMHDVIDCDLESHYTEDDLELDIMSDEPSHPSFETGEETSSPLPNSAAEEICIESSLPSLPAPLEAEYKEISTSLSAPLETECRDDSISSPVPLETEFEEDYDSSSSDGMSLDSDISECDFDSEGSSEPLDIEESFHMRQREEQYLIQQVMSATCNWDSQDEDEEDDSLPIALPSPEPPLGSSEEFLSPSHPWYLHKPVFLSDLLEEPPREESVLPSPISNPKSECLYKDHAAEFLHPPIFKGNGPGREKLQRPQTTPLQLPNSSNYLPLSSLGQGLLPPVNEDPVNQAVHAVQMLTLEDLLDVDQLGSSPPLSNPFDVRSAAALARWDKFPVTGFQIHSFKLPTAPSYFHHSSSVSSAPGVFSGTSEFVSSCATPVQSLFTPSIQSSSSSPQHPPFSGMASPTSLSTGKKTKASSFPGRIGVRQRQKEKRTCIRRCNSAWDQFLGVNGKARYTAPVASSNGASRALSTRARQAARALAQAARRQSRQAKQSQSYEHSPRSETL